MKIRDIEGDAKEIKDLFDNTGFDLNTYLNANKPEESKPVSKQIFSLTGIGYFVTCCLVWINPFGNPWHQVLILLMFVLLIILAIIAHHNLKNGIITLLVGAGGLLVLSISLGVYTPSEAAKKAEAAAMSRIDGDKKDSEKDEKDEKEKSTAKKDTSKGK